MVDNGLLGLIGLCKKASKLCIGEDACANAVKNSVVRAVLTASDSAENTLNRAKTHSLKTGAPHVRLNVTKEELGSVLGMKSCAICTVMDAGFAAAIAKKMANLSQENIDISEQLSANFERIKKRKSKVNAKNKNKSKSHTSDYNDKLTQKRGGDVYGNRK